MATPKRGGEIIDINGRIAHEAATAAEIAQALAGAGTPTDDQNAEGTARAITYSKTEENRSAAASLAVSLIVANKICLAANGTEVEGRLETVEIDLMSGVTSSAQVMHFEARGTVLPGDRLVGTRKDADDSGDYGYVRTATDAELAAGGGRGRVLEGRSGSGTSKVRVTFRG